MKRCNQCGIELPEAAAHCMACGARQVVTADPAAKTMMGHPGMAQELARTTGQPPPAARADLGLSATVLAPPARSVGDASPAIAGVAPTLPAPPPSGGPARPAALDLGGPPTLPVPPPTAAPPGHTFAVAASGGHGGMANTPVPLPVASHRPVAGGLPRAIGPRRAAAVGDTLRTLMLVFGVLLIGCFVAPWRLGGGATQFSWSVLTVEGLSVVERLIPLLLALTGAVAVLLGALAMSAPARGIVAVAIGAPPILYMVAIAAPFAWQSALSAAGSLVLLVGLVLRAHHATWQVPRALIGFGVAAVLAPKLIPSGDVVPLVESVRAIDWSRLDLRGLLDPAHTVVVLACLLTLLPGAGGGAALLAWLLLGFPLLLGALPLLVGDDPLVRLQRDLFATVLAPLATMAWGALVAYGGAAALDRRP